MRRAVVLIRTSVTVLPASDPDSSLRTRLRRWPSAALIGLIRAYRLLLSPWLGSSCRFEPTCSAYGLVALERHGARRGGALTLWRIARCHPWCQGGHDPVPDRSPPSRRLFTSLLERSDERTQQDDDPAAAPPDRARSLANRKTSV
ncbi:hypothetical protein MASR2M32_34730 [Sphaerotilus sulfidivorans]|nr:hypothetical protein CQA4T8M7_04460 [Sphaerotilus natans]GKQ57349.1 hypothetical protein QMTAC487_12080 [Sphaerotilus sp. FB-3]